MFWKVLISGFSVAYFAFENWLNNRQRLKLTETDIPATLRTIVSEKNFSESRSYGLDKLYLAMFSGFVSLIQTLFVIWADLLVKFWSAIPVEDLLLKQVAYVVMLMTLSSLLNLPLSLYSTFMIEQKHGFNKQTLGLFAKDFVQSIIIGVVLGVPFLCAFLRIIEIAGDNFVLYVSALMLVFQLFIITIFPTIQSLFNKFELLEEGSLKSKINALAKKLSFPLTKLFKIDGSKRSSHSNAYFFGFFKNKRIVLFDTLIEQCEEDEILAILGHELGHWKLNHVFKTFIINQFHILAIFYMFSFFLNYAPLYDDMGFRTVRPSIVGFILFNYILTPVDAVMQFAQNVLTRKHEFEADAFATGDLGFGKELRTGLIKIHVKNMGNNNPDSLYSAYHYSHPPLIERLNAMSLLENKKK